MADASEDPTIFTAHSLPSDPRLWATVTNAYLGTRVYHDTLHVSGVYNGAGGDTHRAVLPSPLNVQLEAPAGTGEQLTKTFTLDTNTGSHCLSCPSPQAIVSLAQNAPLTEKEAPAGRCPGLAGAWGPLYSCSFLDRALGLRGWVHLTHNPERPAAP